MTPTNPLSRSDIIRNELPLVRHIARDFCRKYPWLKPHRDDLVQAGVIGLMKAIDRQPKSDKPVSNWIRKFIRIAVNRLQLVRIPLRTMERKKTLRPPTQAAGSEPVDSGIRADRPADVTEFMELLTERQRSILQYRLAGHTDSEIAGLLSIGETTVRDERKKIGYNYEQFRGLRVGCGLRKPA